MELTSGDEVQNIFKRRLLFSLFLMNIVLKKTFKMNTFYDLLLAILSL